MSKKLCKVIETVDLFNEDNLIPERYLVFMDQEGHQTKGFFPTDRMTLIFNGKLYDWYGREVELGPGIKQVLAHFGCRNGETRAHETFVVKRNDGRLAIAALDYKGFQKTTNSNLAKMRTVCGIMAEKPFLFCAPWSFTKFNDSNSRICLNEINKWLLQNFDYACKICLHTTADRQELGEDSIVFVKTYHGALDGRWLRHRIAKSRHSILGSPSLHFPTVKDTDHVRGDIYGDLEFSQDGRKMTAFIDLPYLGKERYPISTDIDIIRHTRDSEDIFWYYDPEP